MNVKKLFIILGSVVVVTLIILFVLNTVMPGVFDWLNCATNTFLGGSTGGTSNLSGCTDKFDLQFGGS